jgi:hypothetical protein
MNLDDLLAAVNARLQEKNQPEMTAADLVDFLYRSILQMRVIRSDAQIAAGRAAAMASMQAADQQAQLAQAANDQRKALIAAD